jgi:hypothetical protein
MPAQFWVSLLNGPTPWQGTNGTALSTATTATISPQAAGSKDFTLPANWWYPGCTLRVTARGLLTTTGTSTTLTVLLAAGATPTTLATTAGMATGTGSLTGLQWQLDAQVTCTGIGSSGNTLSTQGSLWIATTVSPAIGTANCTLAGLPSASGSTAAALDTTSAMAVMLRATLAGANATIQCTDWDLEALN